MWGLAVSAWSPGRSKLVRTVLTQKNEQHSTQSLPRITCLAQASICALLARSLARSAPSHALAAGSTRARAEPVALSRACRTAGDQAWRRTPTGLVNVKHPLVVRVGRGWTGRAGTKSRSLAGDKSAAPLHALSVP
jgi:hypothetical protein